MADDDRVGKKSKAQIEALEARVAELERIVKELVKAIEAAEAEFGEPFMAKGEYCGIKFDD